MNSRTSLIFDKITQMLDDLEKDQSLLKDLEALEEIEDGKAFLLRFKEILEVQQRLKDENMRTM